MVVECKEQERIDDLQRNGYQIIQNPQKFCFGMDAAAKICAIEIQ